MGYCMHQVECDFFIKKENFKKAFDALKKAEPIGYQDISDCSNLIEAIGEFGWNPQLDEDGNIDSLYFGLDKLTDEEIWLDTIAPFVKKGSYLEMSGEDGGLWRWVFDGKNCKEISPRIEWDE